MREVSLAGTEEVAEKTSSNQTGLLKKYVSLARK